MLKSGDVPKGRIERDSNYFKGFQVCKNITIWPDVWLLSIFASACQCDDRRHGNSHQKVVQMIFSSNVYRSMCVQYNQSWFMKGISAEHWHCVFPLEILSGWHWYCTGVPGKNKAMSITRFDSLDRDGLDCLGLESSWKEWNSNEKPNFREPLRDCHVQSDLQIYCTIFGISGRKFRSLTSQWFVVPDVRKVGSLKRAGAEVAVPQRNGKWHAAVARSAFSSQNVRNTACSDHFLKVWWIKMARRCGAKHICKSKCAKHQCFGTLWSLRSGKGFREKR